MKEILNKKRRNHMDKAKQKLLDKLGCRWLLITDLLMR